MKKIDFLSIIIPAYNEENAVLGTLERVRSTMSPLGVEYEIIVINDGSKDKTGEILKAHPGIVLIDRKVNRGYGFSLKEGIEAAKGEWVLITDADGTYPIEDIPHLISDAEDYDMVVGERSKEKVKMGLLNRLAKIILKALIYLLTYRWITDINSGFRLFRRDLALKYANIIPDGFSFTTTITLVAIIEKFRIDFIPINYHERIGKSHIKPMRDFLSFVILVMRIITFFKPLRFFLPISMGFFFLSVIRAVRDIMVANSIGSLSVLLFMISLQTFFFGLVADLIVSKFQNKR